MSSHPKIRAIVFAIGATLAGMFAVSGTVTAEQTPAQTVEVRPAPQRAYSCTIHKGGLTVGVTCRGSGAFSATAVCRRNGSYQWKQGNIAYAPHGASFARCAYGWILVGAGVRTYG